MCRAAPFKQGFTNLVSSGGKGIIGSHTNEGGMSNLNDANARSLAYGLRRSPFYVLKDEEIEMLKTDIEAISADISVFKFNEGRRTSYSGKIDAVHVRGDVLPEGMSNHPRDLMSPRAVLAHEYYGHRPYRNAKKPLPTGSWNDEFRASYMAAKNAPGLSRDDRRYLVLDALERAKSAGVSVTHNSFIRRVLHGF